MSDMNLKDYWDTLGAIDPWRRVPEYVRQPEKRQALSYDISNDLTLIDGVGDYTLKMGCIMSAANARWSFLKGLDLGKATDRLICVAPSVRTLAIGINDIHWWGDNPAPTAEADRTKTLMPYVDKLLETKGDITLELSRAFRCLDFSVRKLTPHALRILGGDEHAFESAEQLERLEPLEDFASAASGARALDSSRFIRHSRGDFRVDFHTLIDATSKLASMAYVQTHPVEAVDRAVNTAIRQAGYVHAFTGNKNVRNSSLDLLSELCEMH